MHDKKLEWGGPHTSPEGLFCYTEEEHWGKTKFLQSENILTFSCALPLDCFFCFFVFFLAPKKCFHREGDGTSLQYSCLENAMDRGAWWAAVHGVGKSRTRLSDFTLTFHFHALEKEMATHSSVLAWRIPGIGVGTKQDYSRLRGVGR